MTTVKELLAENNPYALNGAAFSQFAAGVVAARTQVALLDDGRYALIKERLTTARGKRLVRVSYWKGASATVEAERVQAVWTLPGRAAVSHQAAAPARPAETGELTGSQDNTQRIGS
jgi:hypothetical protein